MFCINYFEDTFALCDSEGNLLFVSDSHYRCTKEMFRLSRTVVWC